MESSTSSNNRSNAAHYAIRLEWVTVAWMVVEASAAIASGVMARSLLLLAFGADSVIELISACVLLWRLGAQYVFGGYDEQATEALEQLASRFSGYLLYALAVYVALQSAYGLFRGRSSEFSALGIATAVIAAVGMPLLAKAKIRVADEIGSQALRADAMESITCGYLSWILLVGLAANALLHWWWLDSAAALLIVPILIKEGHEALTGGCSCGTSEAGGDPITQTPLV